MKEKMSTEILGVFISALGAIIVGWGFSDACSNEIVEKALPLIGSLPGLITTYVARFRKGDVNVLGAKK